ncbi:thioredoxin family protein [Myxococcota bacterium]|nr:thioredoxin family protein [Myxococcota bacterium]MBU1382509.1 thioredoxin family protein [Myxococcota bacterium]MBU1497583.1 thioredoxin family protein [Myxococcota bacterium]
MSFLKEKDRQAVIKEFSKITKDLKVLLFTTDKNCILCKETQSLLEEVTSLHPRIKIESYNESDQEKTAKFKIDKYPALVVTDMDESILGIRFFGIPAGYEFVSLLSALVEVGTGKVELKKETIDIVNSINKPVHIQIFVTPSCPYCPGAVRTGHQMALLNPNITADMVEAQEFAALSNRYHVMGVPRIVINENSYFEGSLAEQVYVERVLKALNGQSGNLSIDLK